MKEKFPRVDISILLFKSRPYLKELMKSLDNIDYPKDKLIIYFTNNASPDDSFDYVQEKGKGKPYYKFLDSQSNLGFAGGHNVVMRISDAKYTFLLNSDTIMQKDALKKLVKRAESDNKIGVIDAKQFPYPHPKEYDLKTGETDWSSGAALLIRNEALKDTGLFDHTFFMYMEDVDLSWRMWAHGWKCIFMPDAKVTHFILELTKHKKGIISVNEFYRSMRNSAFLKLIYRNPLVHFRHMLRMIGIVKPTHFPLLIIGVITVLTNFIYNKVKKIFKKIIRGRLREFVINLIYSISRTFHKATNSFFDEKKQTLYTRELLVLKATLAQFAYYPHLLMRWWLQRKNKKNEHIKFTKHIIFGGWDK